jgi:hypothetical protein
LRHLREPSHSWGVAPFAGDERGFHAPLDNEALRRDSNGWRACCRRQARADALRFARLLGKRGLIGCECNDRGL